jgi:F420-non-reducing hydrogenase iron-sulfur subunit
VEYAQRLLEETGLGRGRLQMYEIAASDAPRWVAAVREMTARVQELGPNPLKRHSREGEIGEFSETGVES